MVRHQPAFEEGPHRRWIVTGGGGQSALGRTRGRHWGEFVSVSGEDFGRLWGGSHGRRHVISSDRLALKMGSAKLVVDGTDETLVRKAEFSLSPNRCQARALGALVAWSRDVYNGSLQHRRDAWHRAQVAISRFDQFGEVPSLRELCPRWPASAFIPCAAPSHGSTRPSPRSTGAPRMARPRVTPVSSPSAGSALSCTTSRSTGPSKAWEPQIPPRNRSQPALYL